MHIDNNLMAGFLISNGCEVESIFGFLRYHSIVDFRFWIDEVVRSDSVNRDSRKFTVSVMSFQPPDLETAKTLCVGTIFRENYIVTTASCVIAHTESAIAVQFSMENGLMTGENEIF